MEDPKLQNNISEERFCFYCCINYFLRGLQLFSPTPDPDSNQEVAGYSGDLRDKPRGYTFLDEMGTTWIKGEYDCSPVGGYPLIDADLEDLEKHPWPDIIFYNCKKI